MNRHMAMPSGAVIHTKGVRKGRGAPGARTRSTITPAQTMTKAAKVPMLTSSPRISSGSRPACAAMAGLLPLDILGELVSIGTLAAFVIVCAGVMVLRVRAPGAPRPFRTPLVWITAPLGIAMCLFMMVFLPLDTWLRLAAWTVIGLAIYYLYSVRHAKPPRYV